MRLGVNFPQGETGSDPIAIRDFGQAAEGAGFDYLAEPVREQALLHRAVDGVKPDTMTG